jgi:SAM-dependent methyltransferase
VLIAPGARVLDVACGGGRHARWLAARGHPVTAVDRDGAALAALAAENAALIEPIEADLENAPWPLPGRRFGAVVVTNYLWRPLMPALLDSVADGGALIYETFAAGNETVGKPTRPDFLLRPGELRAACAGPRWRVLACEEVFLTAPSRFVQRIAAVRLIGR